MKRYIRASEETAWIVTFGQDAGDAESGPIIYSGEYLIYAVSEDEACRKFEDEYAYDLDGYEGCWARRATQKEIDEWYAYMNEPEDLPFSSTRTKKRAIKAAQETYQLYQNKRNENKYIEVKKSKDGHTYYRQFMYWNTDRGPVKNYSGSKTNRGRYHRTRLDSLEQVLEDYVPVDDVHSEEDVFESTKTNKKSIKASEFVVTVGDVEEYYIEADNEDDALQEFLDQYAEPEDLEEYEDDPSYIWVRESEDDIDASKKICASEWPEELTYDTYPEGDQLIEALINAVTVLDIFEEPSSQGGVGSDFFYTQDGDELAEIDLQDEEQILNELYLDSRSKKEFENKVIAWLSDLCNM